MMPAQPILFCWSGGKDSAMALHALIQQDLPIAALLTTVTETYDRISMHGVRRELLVQQAESIGILSQEVCIPPQCVNPIYEARMEEALRIHYAAGVRSDDGDYLMTNPILPAARRLLGRRRVVLLGSVAGLGAAVLLAGPGGFNAVTLSGSPASEQS